MAKRGRPTIADPREKGYIIRLNKKEEKILNDTCEMSGMGRSDVFRTALERMYRDEKFKEEHPLSPLHERENG